MGSSVDVSDRTKRRLEQLQAEIEATTNRAVSQREILDRLVSEGYDSKDALIASFRDETGGESDDEWDGLSEAEIEAFLSGTSDWGFETSEDEVDEILYGK